MSCCHFLPQSTGDSLDDDDDDDDNMNHETKKNTTFNEGTASHSHSHLHHHTHHAFEVSPVVAFPSRSSFSCWCGDSFCWAVYHSNNSNKNRSFMAPVWQESTPRVLTKAYTDTAVHFHSIQKGHTHTHEHMCHIVLRCLHSHKYTHTHTHTHTHMYAY